MPEINAVIVDPTAPGRLVLRSVAAPRPTIAEVAGRPMDRCDPGKAVLHVGG